MKHSTVPWTVVYHFQTQLSNPVRTGHKRYSITHGATDVAAPNPGLFNLLLEQFGIPGRTRSSLPLLQAIRERGRTQVEKPCFRISPPKSEQPILLMIGSLQCF
jgi:hypothetical protein